MTVWMLNKALEQGFAQQCFIGVTAGGENHQRVLKRALCAQVSVSQVDTFTLGQGKQCCCLGSFGQQFGDGLNGTATTLFPVAANDLQRLVVTLQPVASGLKERHAFAELRLAALAIVGPVDLLR